MNLLNFPYSAIIWVLQYLTTLLWGESPRIQIIYARRGYASLHEWQQKEPGEVQYLRAVIDQTICLVYERHQYPLEQWDQKLFTIGDRRRPPEERRRLASEFMVIHGISFGL